MTYFLWDLMARSLSALPSLFLVALSWLSFQLSELIAARARDERMRAMVDRLDDAVFTAVRTVEQVLVLPLKRASSGGTLGMADRATASARAVQVARACLGAKAWLDLGTTLGLSNDELERSLAARVEATVYGLRGQPARTVGNSLRAALNGGRSDRVASEVVSASSNANSTRERNAGVQ